MGTTKTTTEKGEIMKLALIGLMIFMVGCSMPTPYQKGNLMGGYSDFPLSENSFQVSFIGNGFIGHGVALEYTLLRSAEVTLENGFKYFVLIDSKLHRNKIQTITFPETTNSIQCYKEKPDIKGIIYDAMEIRKTLTEKYGIDGPLTNNKPKEQE